MKYKIQENNGVSLFLTLIILTAILSIAFGVTNLIIGEIKISREVPRSLKAYYAAEAGIERSLYDVRRGGGASNIGSPPSCSGGGAVCLDDPEICYSVDVIATGNPTDIKAYGCYKGTRRAVDVSWSY